MGALGEIYGLTVAPEDAADDAVGLLRRLFHQASAAAERRDPARARSSWSPTPSPRIASCWSACSSPSPSRCRAPGATGSGSGCAARAAGCWRGCAGSGHRKVCRPFRDDGFDGVEPVGQRRRARLQDQRRLDLAQEAVAHRRDRVEARPRRRTSPARTSCRTTSRSRCRARPRSPASGVTMRSLALFASGEMPEHVDAAGRFDQLRHPADAGDHRLVPFLEIDFRSSLQRRAARRAPRRAAAPALAPARPPFRWHPTSAPSVRIIAKMPATSRWLNACTATPARISSAAMSACRSENVSTRSGSSARIFGTSARDERRHPRLLPPHPLRPHRIARHADDAPLLAEQIQRLHRLFGQADDAFGDMASCAACSKRCSAPPSASSRLQPARRADDAAVLDPHHLRAELLDLAGLVADIDHRHLGLVAHPWRRKGRICRLRRAIQPGERLVEQQQPRRAPAARGRARRGAPRRRTGVPPTGRSSSGA